MSIPTLRWNLDENSAIRESNCTSSVKSRRHPVSGSILRDASSLMRGDGEAHFLPFKERTTLTLSFSIIEEANLIRLLPLCFPGFFVVIIRNFVFVLSLFGVITDPVLSFHGRQGLRI